MDNLPTREERLLEAMEACRPGADDHLDPSLAPLAEQLAANSGLEDRFQRQQRADARLSAAFRDVPVPEGLASRVLARLAEARAVASVPQAARLTASPTPDPVAVVTAPVRSSRRWMLASGAAACLAGAVVVAVWVGLHPGPELTSAELPRQATDFFREELQGTSADGTLVAASPPPAEYRYSSELRAFSPAQVRWRNVPDFLGTPAIAYDLPPLGAARATLYVVRRTVGNLPPGPPDPPTLTTGGCSTGAWQEGDLLYVLVVEGEYRAYENYLRPSGTIT